jgi:hypothetical protein
VVDRAALTNEIEAERADATFLAAVRQVATKAIRDAMGTAV